MAPRNRGPALKSKSTGPAGGTAPGAHPPRPGRAPDELVSPPLFSALFRPREPYLVPLLLALFLRGGLALEIPFASEDAYITFRFAENWARGLGPVYNAGERVMGFSSPLWTAWLALGSVFTGPVLWWARAWGLAFDLAALVVATRMLQREHGRASAWAFALFFALYPIFAANAILGMETSLFLCLLFVAADRVTLRRPEAGVWLGLLALMRPEALLCAGLLALKADGRARGIALAIVAAAGAALTAYFGSPIPQSVLAKAATYGVGGPAAGIPWIEGLVPVFVTGRWPETGEGTNLFPFALIALPAIALAAKRFWDERRKRRATALVALAGIAVLAGYFIAGVPYFFWYGVVPIAAWALAACVGLPLLTRSRWLYASLALYLASDTLLLRHLFVERVRQEAISFWQTGEALRALSGGRGTVFLEPLGHVGYVTGMRVYDEVGLVSPDVAKRRAQGAGWYADIVRAKRPDWLVVRDGFFERNKSFAGVSAPFRSPEELAEVRAAYEVVPTPPRAVGSGLTLLRRRP